MRFARRKVSLCAFLAALALAPWQFAVADVTVPVGTSHAWSEAEGGEEGCRRGALPYPCSSFTGETKARPDERSVETGMQETILPGDLGLPFYSTASVYNDFEVGGPAGHVLEAQISVRYDFFGNLLGLGLYTLSNTLTLSVEDLTDGSLLGQTELTSMQRQGDQGFTDVSGSHERSVALDEVGHLSVKVRRGHEYRVRFTLESMGVTFEVGFLRADGFAEWHALSVTLDEDEVALLEQHDGDMKNEFNQVDADHVEIKARLTGIEGRLTAIEGRLTGIEGSLAEIKALLLTPQGRRPGFPLK